MRTIGKKRKALKIVVFLGIAGLISIFWVFDLSEYLTLDALKEHRNQLESYYSDNPLAAAIIYFAVYVLTTASSLPGAAILTLAGGAIFGLTRGTIIVSLASTIGASLAFLISRFLLKDYAARKFSSKLQTINQGMQKDGGYYLLSLRLLPAVPFFLINILMGLTSIRLWKFFVISQIGMLPATIIYVFAGVQLSKIYSPQDIVSSQALIALFILAFFPLATKKIMNAVNSRKVLGKFKPSKSFDYNLAVIGAGAAGLTSAYLSSALKAKTALIEKHKMGGDCLNTGCVPSKALISSARILSYRQKAAEFGFKSVQVDFSFGEVMERVAETIRKIEPHDSVERYREMGVDCYQGEARIIDPYRIEVNGKTITAKNIIVATGASPAVVPIPGIEGVSYLTSDTVWNLRRLPEKLVVLGGGAIGCELAQSFARFGSEVFLVELASRILNGEDPEVSKIIDGRLRKEGVRVLVEHRAEKFELKNNRKFLVLKNREQELEIQFDEVILCLGRKPNVRGFGLEELGVELSPDGSISSDSYLATNFPNIFVCGDVAGPFQFTHAASHQAWHAAVNALFRPFKKFRVDYSLIPRCVFCDPEVAGIGLTETEAERQGVPRETTIFDMGELDRAIVENEERGFVKVLTEPGKDKILGVSIVGSRAGELISQFALAMKSGKGLNQILKTIHPYPTFMEANKYLAGVWRKNHAPRKILNLLEKFHDWRR